jgi:hypothetical protein
MKQFTCKSTGNVFTPTVKKMGDISPYLFRGIYSGALSEARKKEIHSKMNMKSFTRGILSDIMQEFSLVRNLA